MRTAALLLLAAFGLQAQTQQQLLLGFADAPVTPIDTNSGGGCTGSSPSWTCTGAPTITLTDTTATTIVYTTSGTTPNCVGTGTLYTTPFTGPSSTFTLKAIGCNGISDGAVLSSVYTISSAVPAFISGRSSQITAANALGTQSNTGTGVCPTDTYCVFLPQGSLSGNLITLFMEYSSTPSTTLTVTTDQSQTMTAGPVTSVESLKVGAAFYLCGATANTRRIQIAATSAITIDHVFVGQYNNVASSSCLDTSSNNVAATSTTLTAGSLTPVATGELIVNNGCSAGTPLRTSFTVGSQTNITWKKRGSDIQDGCMEQWGVYSSTSALNPTFTTAPTSTFLATAMAFKSASAGTAPSGMYISYQSDADQLTGNTAYKVEFPTTGNLLAMISQGDISTNEVPILNSITDATNTWKNSGSDYFANLNGGTVQPFNQEASWYAPNAAANGNGALTLVQPAAGSTTTMFMFWDITGAATTNPLISRAVYSGDQANGTAVNMVTNFFPGSASGIVLGSLGQFQNTSVSLSAPSGSLFGSSTYGGQDLNGPSQPDENNLWASLANTSASAQTWTDVMASASANVGGWSAEADSFLASGGTLSGPSFSSLSTNQGTASATLAVTIPSTVSGISLVAVVGSFNGTARTVSKICLDGTTCAAGNSFTQATSAACTNGAGNAGDVWYLLSPNTGKTTATVTYSASASNTEAGVYEVNNITTFDLANHKNSATGVANINAGQAITSTGAPGFLVSLTGTSGGTDVNPNTGNEFGYGGAIFSNTTDAFQSLIAAAGSHHFDTFDGSATATFCNSIAAFK